MGNLLEQVSWSGALGLLALAAVPLILVTATSFLKLAVVFSVLKNALGAPDIPSGIVITALAAMLSVSVMAPTARQVQQAVVAHQAAGAGATSPAQWFGLALQPLRTFLKNNAGTAESEMLLRLARERDPEASADDLWVVWPAFALRELSEAFQIGLLVFLPFLVVDLLVAFGLLALGAQAVNPLSVALPLKLLLFVAAQGWLVISEALLGGYQ